MPDPKKPTRPKTTDEILREMEAMSKNVGGSSAENATTGSGGGGALKSLLGFFVKIEPEQGDPPGPAAASGETKPRTVTGQRVSELIAGEPAPKFSAAATNEELASKPFDEIYRQAGIPVPQCSVDELGDLLESPTVANQPVSVKVIAVNLALSAKGITAAVPISDAIRRDRALDAYQTMLEERARTAEERNTGKVQQITKEVEEYLTRKQAEMDSLKAETAKSKRQCLEFAARREVEEKRMADLISPFLEGQPNPVTVGSQSQTPEKPA